MMTRITLENMNTLPVGARIWVKEWDEVHRFRKAVAGVMVTDEWYLNPAKLSLYHMTPDGPPKTQSTSTFYHVHQVTWQTSGAI
jgi:hypothetical protein